jgi:hypothetical protein
MLIVLSTSLSTAIVSIIVVIVVIRGVLCLVRIAAVRVCVRIVAIVVAGIVCDRFQYFGFVVCSIRNEVFRVGCIGIRIRLRRVADVDRGIVGIGIIGRFGR